jgi:hypothetical protein
MSQERYKDLNLTPPEEGFELYRHKNVDEMTTRGWSGLYWARKNEALDYEIRAVIKREKDTLIPAGYSRKRPLRGTTKRPISFRRNSLFKAAKDSGGLASNIANNSV